jgi:YD repeat-containing protein
VLSYPSTSNLVSAVTQGSTAVRSFTYDAAGNVTADNRAGTVYNYRYNNRARLDRLTIGSTVTADYTYDGLERLAIRATQNMTPAGTTHYVYDRQGHLIVEADASGNTVLLASFSTHNPGCAKNDLPRSRLCLITLMAAASTHWLRSGCLSS